MSSYVSKYCADHLRNHYGLSGQGKLKASHAHELVAAFFGYKSHAALLADPNYRLSELESASILVPNVPLLEKRRLSLSELPTDLPLSQELAEILSESLKTGGYFNGDVWLYSSLEEFIIEDFLHKQDHIVMDDLSGVMAETNALFDEAYYESAAVSDGEDEVVIQVDGTYSGQNDEDRPFCGDQIDMKVTVTLYRAAGRTGFSAWDVSASGEVNDDWVDPELRYGTSST